MKTIEMKFRLGDTVYYPYDYRYNEPFKYLDDFAVICGFEIKSNGVWYCLMKTSDQIADSRFRLRKTNKHLVGIPGSIHEDDILKINKQYNYRESFCLNVPYTIDDICYVMDNDRIDLIKISYIYYQDRIGSDFDILEGQFDYRNLYFCSRGTTHLNNFHKLIDRNLFRTEYEYKTYLLKEKMKEI